MESTITFTAVQMLMGVVGIILAIIGVMFTGIKLIFGRMDRMEDRLNERTDERIDALRTELTANITASITASAASVTALLDKKIDELRTELKGDIAKVQEIAMNTDRNVSYIFGLLNAPSLQEVEAAVPPDAQRQEAVVD